MKKKFIVLGSVCLIIFCLMFPQKKVSAKEINKVNDNYKKGVVKINMYYEDADYLMTKVRSGAGVIISEDGWVLTNYHVMTDKNNDGDLEYEDGVEICLYENQNTDLECKYRADVITIIAENDLVIFKIRDISGLSNKKKFDFFSLSETKSKVGDRVRSVNFDLKSNDSLVVSDGLISGIEDNDLYDYIKTDAILSSDLSGGALINDKDELIGIVNRSKYDLFGLSGSALRVNSFENLINFIKKDFKNNEIRTYLPRADEKIEKLLKKKNEFNGTRIFNNDNPKIKFEAVNEWKVDIDDPSGFKVVNKDISDGFIDVSWRNNLIDVGKKFEEDFELYKIANPFMVEALDLDFQGIKTKKIIENIFGLSRYKIIVPINTYYIIITYFYGENNKDKDSIDAMLQKIIIGDAVNYEKERVIKKYKDDLTGVSVVAGKNWSFLERNSSHQSIIGVDNDNYNTRFILHEYKVVDIQKNLSNEAYYGAIKDDEKIKGMLEDSTGLKAETIFSSTNYKVNNDLNNMIYYKYRFSDNNKKPKVFASVYRYYNGERINIFQYYYVGSDENKFNKLAKDFENNIMKKVTVAKSMNQGEYFDKIINKHLKEKLSGKILLKVEDNGKAYYVNPNNKNLYYLGRPRDAFNVMKEQGVGISNADLEKIPISFDFLSGDDSDLDGLPDMLEDAIGTDKNNNDSDGDGYKDYDEIKNNYKPNGIGSIKINNTYSHYQKGKIFLQVERKGEAWYVNPKDGKRYFLGRPADAFRVMKELGLGVSNQDFDQL